jgi:hypothetical protein
MHEEAVMSATYDNARDRARAAREELGAKLETGGVKRPELARDSGCDHWYEKAEGHYVAGDKALAADHREAAILEYETGLASETAGDACHELRSTLP